MNSSNEGENIDKKKCFIIMPISTPEDLVPKYSSDVDHFKHVLYHLIIPSLQKADIEPIPPTTKGSEVIHGDIIKKIEAADLVLCDMSTLNPNVFFELGIRIALNKSVCLIKDDLTPQIPFDTRIINNMEYSSSLFPWNLDKEIEKLVEHIKESGKGSGSTNSLWKYFGLSSIAHPVEPENGIEGKLNYLITLTEGSRSQSLKNSSYKKSLSEGLKGDLVNKIRTIASERNIEVNIRFLDDIMVIESKKFNPEFKQDVSNVALYYDVSIFLQTSNSS